MPKPAGDTSPGQWRQQPDQYAIGLPQPYNNANGGVALGYGYQQNGALDIGACRATVWSTGERLLDPGDPNAAPGSYAAVDGLQGNSPDLVEPQNEPPTNAWFIDYSDQPSSPLFRGYMGAIQILSPCSEQGAYVPPPPPPPPPPVLRCPPGSIYRRAGQCVVTVSCPPGSVYRNGYCVYESCPPGYVRYRNRCVPPPQVCPPGTAFDDGQCVPVGCPPGMVQLPSGYCACPPGIYYFNGRCVPPSSCPPGMVTLPGGICWCPLNTYFVAGQCIPNYCPPGYYRRGGQCVPKFCQPGYDFGPDGFCHPRFNPCPPDRMPYLNYCVPKFCQPGTFRGNDGYCYVYGNTCGPGQEFFGGRCVTACLPLFKRDLGGICINIVEFDRKQNLCQGGKIRSGNGCACPPDKQEVNGACVRAQKAVPLNRIICTGGSVPQGDACVCPANKPNFVNGVCVPRAPAKPAVVCSGGSVPKGDGCVCPADKPDFVNGVCVAKPPAKPAVVCSGGSVPQGDGCVCPADKPDFVNGVCVAKAPAKPALVCTGGRVQQGDACVCPADKPDFVNGVCVAKPPAKPALVCTGGSVPQGDGCVCLADKPTTLSTGSAVAKAPAKPALVCTGGRVQQGDACVCPADKPDFANGVCVAKPAKPALVCTGGRAARRRVRCPADKPDLNGSALAAGETPLVCTGGRVQQGDGVSARRTSPTLSTGSALPRLRRNLRWSARAAACRKATQCVCPADKPDCEPGLCSQAPPKAAACPAGETGTPPNCKAATWPAGERTPPLQGGGLSGRRDRDAAEPSRPARPARIGHCRTARRRPVRPARPGSRRTASRRRPKAGSLQRVPPALAEGWLTASVNARRANIRWPASAPSNNGTGRARGSSSSGRDAHGGAIPASPSFRVPPRGQGGAPRGRRGAVRKRALKLLRVGGGGPDGGGGDHPMSVDKATVKRVARLARIAVSDAEAEALKASSTPSSASSSS